MFEHMVSDLKSGLLPEQNILRRRFDAALVKKMAVLRTPYSFWPADPKINPPTKQLLWAAILLQDKENFSMIEAVITTEVEEKPRAKGQTENIHSLTDKIRQIRQNYIHEFIELGPNETFRENLRQKVAELLPGFQDSSGTI